MERKRESEEGVKTESYLQKKYLPLKYKSRFVNWRIMFLQESKKSTEVLTLKGS
jgi:hypothetical protein